MEVGRVDQRAIDRMTLAMPSRLVGASRCSLNETRRNQEEMMASEKPPTCCHRQKKKKKGVKRKCDSARFSFLSRSGKWHGGKSGKKVRQPRLLGHPLPMLRWSVFIKVGLAQPGGQVDCTAPRAGQLYF
jgi:hypothetical protein